MKAQYLIFLALALLLTQGACSKTTANGEADVTAGNEIAGDAAPADNLPEEIQVSVFREGMEEVYTGRAEISSRLGYAVYLLPHYGFGRIEAEGYDVIASELEYGLRRYVSAAEGLNLRESANRNARVITALRMFTEMELLETSAHEETIDGQRSPWFRVEAEGGWRGWVFGAHTKPAGNYMRIYEVPLGSIAPRASGTYGFGYMTDYTRLAVGNRTLEIEFHFWWEAAEGWLQVFRAMADTIRAANETGYGARN